MMKESGSDHLQRLLSKFGKEESESNRLCVCVIFCERGEERERERE